MRAMWRLHPQNLPSGGKDGKLQTALALVGFIPFGDLFKFFKSGGKKAAVEAAQKAIKEGAPAPKRSWHVR